MFIYVLVRQGKSLLCEKNCLRTIYKLTWLCSMSHRIKNHCVAITERKALFSELYWQRYANAGFFSWTHSLEGFLNEHTASNRSRQRKNSAGDGMITGIVPTRCAFVVNYFAPIKGITKFCKKVQVTIYSSTLLLAQSRLNSRFLNTFVKVTSFLVEFKTFFHS